jgi:hypothetical protein
VIKSPWGHVFDPGDLEANSGELSAAMRFVAQLWIGRTTALFAITF